ncbi:MAG: VOC family protein [Actinobacteria bacterium]|nr:VOC family protein [Actinomycetota bacterium]
MIAALEPVLDQVNIVVRDMDAAVAFYELLGVKVPTTTSVWDPHHRSAAITGGADIDLDSQAFAKQWDEGWPAGTSGAVLTFRVSDRDEVDAIYTRLTESGIRRSRRPTTLAGAPASLWSPTPTATPSPS